MATERNSQDIETSFPIPAGNGISAGSHAERPDVHAGPAVATPTPHSYDSEGSKLEFAVPDQEQEENALKQSAVGQTHGFFASEMASERKAYCVLMARTVLMVVLLMWLSLPAFWGALSNSAKLTHNLTAWFVDRDGSRVGHGLWDGFKNSTELGWVSVDPVSAGTNQQIIDAIVTNRAWVAVVVEANATSNLGQARRNGDRTYDPTSAITVYYAQARHEIAVGTYLLPMTQSLLSATIQGWATSSAQRYFAQITPGDAANETAIRMLAIAPQTINPGIAFKLVNLRPYRAPAAQAVTVVGNIFLVIFAFFITMANSHARALVSPKLALPSYIALRILAPMVVYIPLSLSYMLVSLAFDLPFDGKYSQGVGFIAAFVFVYLGTTALGLALESMITILTPRFIPFFLFPLIIYNVAPVLMPDELQSPFYLYGHGFPIPNLSLAIRTIFFNTQSTLGLNAGVIISWIILSIGTLFTFTYLTHRPRQRHAITALSLHHK